jgi:hypothetical protein
MIIKEIFKQSTSNKYYSMGLAQGIAYSCLLASELEPTTTLDEWAKVFRNKYDDKDFLEYFDRFIDEYRRNKQLKLEALKQVY